MNRRDFALRAALGLGAAAVLGPGAVFGRGAGASPNVTSDALRLDMGDGSSVLLDSVRHRVSLWRANGQMAWRHDRAGTGALELNSPRGAAMDAASGWIYVANHGNANVLGISPEGEVVALGAAAQLAGARDIACHQGRLYVCDTANHRVQVITTRDQRVGTIGQFGTDDRGLNGPVSLAIDIQERLHVADVGGQRLQTFALDGAWLGSYGRGLNLSPRSISADTQGQVHVADAIQNRIFRFSPRGELLSRDRVSDGLGRPAIPLALSASDAGINILAAAA